MARHAEDSDFPVFVEEFPFRPTVILISFLGHNSTSFCP